MPQTQMTQAEAVAAMQAIDWQKLFDKLPQALALILQLVDLFKQRPLMASGAAAGDHNVCACLTEQQKHLLEALAHNAHLLNCCQVKP